MEIVAMEEFAKLFINSKPPQKILGRQTFKKQ